MSFEAQIVAAGADRTRLWVAVAFVVALITTLSDFGRLLADGYAAVRFRWELDYGEGIVWEQMRLMVAGRAYGSIDGLPAIVFHYPPVYHMLTAALSAATGIDALAVGRSVSIGSTVLAGLFAGLIARKAVRDAVPAWTALMCGAVAGLTFFCFSPIAFWAPLMRVDMLSLALTLAGLLVAMTALARPPLIVAAGLLFVAAVFTKQTSIVAPAAVFLTFLVLQPKLAWRLAATCVVTGLIVLGALIFVTDGGFIRHVFLYNANRFDPEQLLTILIAIGSHSFFVAAVLIGVVARLQASVRHYRGARTVAALRQRLGETPDDAFFLLLLVYALLAFLMAFAVGKSGSNMNYFIEWMTALAILLGVVTRDAANAACGAMRGPNKNLFAHPLLLPLLIGLQPLMKEPPADYTRHRSPVRVAELEVLQAMVRSAPRPVISDDMVLLLRSGAEVQWEPAIFAELASTAAWDEGPFVERIKAGHFAFFVTAGKRGERLFDSRYNRAVADALDVAYPLRRELAGYTIHLPAQSVRTLGSRAPD